MYQRCSCWPGTQNRQLIWCAPGTQMPIFTAEECDQVVVLAEAEGAGLPSTASGKYQLGKVGR